MTASIQLPRLYPIIDAAYFSSSAGPLESILNFAEELMLGGATLIQYRNKPGNVREALDHLRELRKITERRARLIVNDRVDLCLACDGDGVHLGQEDLPPVAARRIFESAPAFRQRLPWIGFSTHNLAQLQAATRMPVDYLAIGPVFATSSKANPDPVVGLQGVRQARQATSRPLVAIGGINRGNCRQVIDSGADCVAIISDLVESPRAAVREFLRILR